MKKIFLCICCCYGFTSCINAVDKTSYDILTNGKTIETTIGFTTAAGYYAFDPKISSMKEGADRIFELGSKVIKLWLIGGSENLYTYNTDWSRWQLNNCVDLLKTDYYRSTLDKDFHTIVLETQTFDATNPETSVKWEDGMTANECKRVQDEMYEIAKYLFTQYNKSNKTFLLQNWEGDNMLGNEHWRRNSDNGFLYIKELGAGSANAKTDAEIKTKIRGFIDWCNFRQDGVDSARNELANIVNNISVLNVLEANFSRADSLDAFYENHPLLITPWAYDDTPMVINTVVPFTNCDLYSLSCWGATSMARANTLQARLNQFEYFIGDKYTDIYYGNKIKHRRPMQRENQKTKLILGEYGASERAQSGDKAWEYTDELSFETARRQREVIQIQTDIALKHGLEYIIYWQIYCNDARNDIENIMTRQAAIEGKHATNEQLKGYWAIRADGSYTEVYKYFHGLLCKDALYLNKKSEYDKEYVIPGISGGFEISGSLVSQDKPSNLAEAWSRVDKIAVLGSKDKKNYQEIPLNGFYTVTDFAEGKYMSDIRYINKYPVDTTYRHFKITDKTNGAEIELANIKFYKPNPDNLKR